MSSFACIVSRQQPYLRLTTDTCDKALGCRQNTTSQTPSFLAVTQMLPPMDFCKAASLGPFL